MIFIKVMPPTGQRPVGGEVLMGFSFELLKKMYQRQYKKSCGKVACGVQEIKVKAGGDPGDGAVKVKPKEQCLRGGVEHAEQESVQCANADI